MKLGIWGFRVLIDGPAPVFLTEPIYVVKLKKITSDMTSYFINNWKFSKNINTIRKKSTGLI